MMTRQESVRLIEGMSRGQTYSESSGHLLLPFR